MATQVQDLTTLTLYKDLGAGASTNSVDVVRRSDGSFEFTDANGNVQTAHSNEKMRLLFEVLDAIST